MDRDFTQVAYPPGTSLGASESSPRNTLQTLPFFLFLVSKMGQEIDFEEKMKVSEFGASGPKSTLEPLALLDCCRLLSKAYCSSS
eukprot:408482-Rhodomonas_salina.3